MAIRKKHDSLLQQLENNEAVLLMYLADELPVEDRAEVEQLLAVDAGMRRSLEELRGAMEASTEAFRRLDATSPLPLSQAAALRQTSRLVRQWQVKRLTRDGVDDDEAARRRGLRFAWWTYPLATAAAVLLAFLVWWGNQPGVPGSNFGIPAGLPGAQPYVEQAFEEPDANQILARDLQDSFVSLDFNSYYGGGMGDPWRGGGWGQRWLNEDAISNSESDDPISTKLWTDLNQTSQNTR